MNPESRPFELGKNRIEALSDGLFAIAMTLLVLELKVPELPHNSPNVIVFPALMKLVPKLGTYAVSFISLGVFWVGHHNMYHAIRRADRVLLWLNILFFMFVSLLPFATSVLNAFPMAQIVTVVFGLNLTLIGWTLYLQWVYACTQPDMLAEFITPAYRDLVRSRFLTYPVVATLTILICFWSIEISLGIYLLLLPLYMIPGKINQPGVPGLEAVGRENGL
ncbi:MAG TPA: TMEM175 family protein [Chthonomonadaceae bacterium]|nr:TMEM175 family protein [Chthonomonadaceae bacterium]